jgi:hypothetical protein
VKRARAGAENPVVILSDRSSGGRPGRAPGAPSGASTAPSRPDGRLAERPVPKALCEACGRPVANLRSPTCVYCGAPVPEALRAGVVPQPKSGIPAEMLVMLEPRAGGERAGRKRWLVRLAAAAVATVVLLLIVRLLNPPG